jgi:hypothetical protein
MVGGLRDEGLDPGDEAFGVGPLIALPGPGEGKAPNQFEAAAEELVGNVR